PASQAHPNGQTIAYIANTFGGLESIDVTDPAHPMMLGSVTITKPAPTQQNPNATEATAAVGLTIEGNIAYVAGYEAGLVLVNIADPAHPAEISRVKNYVFPDVAGNDGMLGNLPLAIVQAVGVTKIGNIVWVSDIGTQTETGNFSGFNGV